MNMEKPQVTFVLNERNTIANQYLEGIRSIEKQANRLVFRRNMERLGFLLGYEVSKMLQYQKKNITTPLGNAEENCLLEQPVLITILRAGIPFYQGVLEAFDEADSGFVGAYRAPHEKGDAISIETDYFAIPNLQDKIVLLIDPMLASGNSMIKAINQIQQYGIPSHIHIISAIAAAGGLANLKQNVSLKYSVWTAAIDADLNDLAYIVPGLGDAGDLSFGGKS